MSIIEDFYRSYPKELESWFIAHEAFQNFIQQFDLEIRNHTTWLKAFTHRSFIHEYSERAGESYERLEFLGDALLEKLVSDYLFFNFPDYSEGEMSKIRSSVVNERVLAKWTRALGLDELLLVGKGEFQNGGLSRQSFHADILESFLAAVYIDLGSEEMERVFLQSLEVFEKKYQLKFFEQVSDQLRDPKTTLQELVVKVRGEFPTYRSEKITQDGEEVYKVGLYVFEDKVLEMVHPSKKKAEKILAQRAIEEEIFQEIKND